MSQDERASAPEPDGEAGDEPLAASVPNAAPVPYSDRNLPQPGAVLGERYRVERELGRGGMAVVYEATELASGQRVALKWLFEGRTHKQERRRRFLREARATSSINHPNVVRVFDAGEHESGVFFAMEVVEGESLRTLLARGPMEPVQAVDLLMTALRGVAAAHAKGVVHRDLKPENLYVCKGSDGKPQIKILDFGLSKLLGPAADSLHTLPGMLIGTAQYMSPEQADSRLGPIDARSDIHTLGMILFEALAGRGPFQSQTLAGYLMQVSREDPSELSDVAPNVPRELADVVMWALSRDPELRPRNVEEWAVELEPFGTLPFAGERGSSQIRVSKRAPRKPSERPARASDRAAKKASERPAAQSVRAPAASVRPAAPQRMGFAIGALVLLVLGALVWWLTRGEPAAQGIAAPSPAQAVAAKEPATAPPAAPELPSGKLPPDALEPAVPEPASAEPKREASPARERKSETAEPEPRKQSRGVFDPWN